jgi:hypothetical protein
MLLPSIHEKGSHHQTVGSNANLYQGIGIPPSLYYLRGKTPRSLKTRRHTTTIQIKKLANVSAILAALIATPALAQEWDADADGQMTIAEFKAGVSERAVFTTWDANTDGMLDNDEFTNGIFSRYDADISSDWNDTEYGMAQMRYGSTWWGDRENVTGLEAWDVDGDGILLRNEFHDGWGQQGMLGKFDINADNLISEEEFSTGIFNQYDIDGDRVISTPELTDIGDDLGDGGFWDA